MRVALDQRMEMASNLLQRLKTLVGDELADDILIATQKSEADIAAQRERVERLKARLAELQADPKIDGHQASITRLLSLADVSVK